jgi:hypothetical protein
MPFANEILVAFALGIGAKLYSFNAIVQRGE